VWPQGGEHLSCRSANELDHLTLGCSESLTVDGNVQNWSITNNLIHDNNNIGIDAIGFEGVSPSTSTDQARDGLISGNTIYNITSYGNPAYGNSYSSDGIYCDRLHAGDDRAQYRSQYRLRGGGRERASEQAQ
jgi:hypothetical protein